MIKLLPSPRGKQIIRSYRVINMDVLDWAHFYTGPKFHGMLSDTPYNLDTIAVRFGKNGSSPAKHGTNGVYSRSSRGFMNQQWDNDIAFHPETWAALCSHLYPGAFGMAYASTRGWHRLACAIEDAGMIIHPTIFNWTFGSGFPKATRIKDDDRFEGYRYGLQAMKPATEPIIVFQKPYKGKPLDNIRSTGAGAFNIDGGRIGTSGSESHASSTREGTVYGSFAAKQTVVRDQGRWPANFTLTHTPYCQPGACIQECAVYQFGEMTGDRSAGGRVASADSNSTGKHVYNGGYGRVSWEPYDDDGSAARYYFQADWNSEVQEQIESGFNLMYEPKVSQRERNLGLETFTPTKVNDGRNSPIDNAYQRAETERLNIHPTVKPIALNKWLSTLLLPPGEFSPRRILNPFSGSGSEMIGAMLAGWEEVVGVELGADYSRIAQARLKYYAKQPVQMEMF